MPVNLKKDEVQIQTASFQNAPIVEKRICKECRYYRVSWLAFCCVMLGSVIPFAIVEISKHSELFANIFLTITSLAALIVFLIMKPIEIEKADQQYKDMNYHSHYHI